MCGDDGAVASNLVVVIIIVVVVVIGGVSCQRALRPSSARSARSWTSRTTP
jgi:hypothetical protein